MRASFLKELLLYRYRFIAGYGILLFLCIGLTTWQLSSVPPGFSAAEQQSSVISSAISSEVMSYVDAPYHFVQKTTLMLFGPSPLGIRLPSVVAAIVFVASAYLLLRRWFGESSAVIGAILTVSSVHFLLHGRSGDPLIMHYLWPTLLLLTATLASAQGKQWRFWVWAFAAVAGLSLYTPYVGLLAAVIAVVTVASRGGRILLADIGGPFASLAALSFVALAAPWAYTIYTDPAQFHVYFNFSTANAAVTTERVAELWRAVSGTSVEGNFTPALSIPAAAFLVYGVIHSLRNIALTRYVVIILWLLIAGLLYAMIANVPASILFLPLALLVIIGLHRFINRWYELFPRNPYARVSAILPITLIVAVMVQFNYQRYFFVLPQAETVRASYNNDIVLLQRHLDAQPRTNSIKVVVSDQEKEFINLIDERLVQVASVSEPNLNFNGERLLVSRAAYTQLSTSAKAALAEREATLVVDGRSGDDAVRFREY